MQEIDCALSPVPVSPTVDTDSAQVQHPSNEVLQDGTLSELHDQRLALEKEVANLKERLVHEIKLREALEGGLQRSPGTLPRIPGYVPAKMRELLFEVAVVEEEVIFLEKHAVYLQQELRGETQSELSLTTEMEHIEEDLSRKLPALIIEIPEIAEQPSSMQIAEPMTPIAAATPSGTPFGTPPLAWGPSNTSSPSPMQDKNIPLPLPIPPPAFALPLPLPSSAEHGDELRNVPPLVLNRKRVIRRGSSSSESLPADLGESKNVGGKPSRKKPNHKKSASLTSDVRKADMEFDINFTRPSVRKEINRGDVYQRLSAPKNGGHVRSATLSTPPVRSSNAGHATLKRSTSLKESQSKYPTVTSPSPPTSVIDKVNNSVKRRTDKKELHGRSPPLASPQLATRAVPCFRRSYSDKVPQHDSSPVSNPSPIFEDKDVASIDGTMSSMSPMEVSQLKFCNYRSLPVTPTGLQEIPERLVPPFALPYTVEKENVKFSTMNDERQRTHDLVITKSLPPIKLTKASNKATNPFKGGFQQLLTGATNHSENAKIYGKAKVSGTPTKQGFKVRPVQVQKPSSKGGANQATGLKLDNRFHSAKDQADMSDDKDDKVGMACGPIADAAWLSEDLARLLGTVCSKMRWHSSSAESAIKSPVPLLGSSQKVLQYHRSPSFDIRSRGGLQLLQEYCSDDMDISDSYDVSKNRTEDVGPHRHYYKAIKLPLEQKLKGEDDDSIQMLGKRLQYVQHLESRRPGCLKPTMCFKERMQGLEAHLAHIKEQSHTHAMMVVNKVLYT